MADLASGADGFQNASCTDNADRSNWRAGARAHTTTRMSAVPDCDPLWQRGFKSAGQIPRDGVEVVSGSVMWSHPVMGH